MNHRMRMTMIRSEMARSAETRRTKKKMTLSAI